MQVGIATDHGGFSLKEDLAGRLRAAGHEVIDFGATALDPNDDYPDFVAPLARAVAAGQVERGIAVCGSGVGASICANKIPGVRAATAHDPYSAERARKSNDAQVLTMGARVIAPQAAEKVLDHWLASEFEGGGSAPKVEKMNAVDARFRAARTG